MPEEIKTDAPGPKGPTVLVARRKGQGDEGVVALGAGRFGFYQKADGVDEAGIDSSKLAVPCVISTQAPDREEDVIVTAGIDLATHRLNPVVLIDHGFPRDDRYPSVARAEDPSGNYTVTLGDGVARAVSWFTDKVQESYQTFTLIKEGLLRGVSIGFIPRETEYRRDRGDDYRGFPGLCVSRSELVEYSHCPIGVNPYALADRIGKGYLGSERLSDVIYKSLSPLLPPLKEAAAVSLPDNLKSDGGEPVAETVKTEEKAPAPAEPRAPEPEVKAEQKAPEVKAPELKAPEAKAPEAPPAPAAQNKGMNETTGSDGGYVAVDGGGKSGEDPTAKWKPGAKALAGCYGMLSALGAFIRSASDSQENPTVAEALASYGEQVDAMSSHAGDTFKSLYADYGELSADEPEGKSAVGFAVKSIDRSEAGGLRRESAALKAQLAAALADRDAHAALAEEHKAAAERSMAMVKELQAEWKKRTTR